MCGLVGGMHCGHEQLVRLAARDMLQHRGPDSSGYWEKGNSWLAHRRLAIQDLSPAGHQPMTSHNERWTVVFNGEIYNQEILKRELEKEKAFEWRGHSDTEVLLEAVTVWGVDAAIRRLRGMFALALFDHENGSMSLVRDPLGEKPLYWIRNGESVYFASEIKAFNFLPKNIFELDADALFEYLSFGFVRSPYTIFKDIRKVCPGEILEISAQGRMASRAYYNAFQEIQPFEGSFDEALSKFDELFAKSAEQQLISDVPLGALLSGGVDSSLIAAHIRKTLGFPLKTYSVRIEKDSHNEAPYARAIAEYLGCEHHELSVGLKDAEELVPSLSRWWDEPLGDSSQIPTLLISRMARKHVSVCLSGDGGDELFYGYQRYAREEADARSGIFKGGAALLRALPRIKCFGERMMGWSDWAAARSSMERYRYRLQLVPQPARFFEGAVRFKRMSEIPAEVSERPRYIGMRIFDLKSYLPEDILAKVDRGSMACGLELRAPFLARDLVQFALSLPPEYLVDERGGKRILKTSLEGLIPRELFERPKKGFSIPLREWLRDRLRPWAEDLLHSELINIPHLHQRNILDYWEKFQRGEAHANGFLWALLQLLSWRRYWSKTIAA